jgi:hypothetical protein
MTKLITGVAAVLVAFSSAGTAGAYPTPEPAPSPGYVIQTPKGPQIGGLRTLAPICGTQPLACAGHWNPDTGTWDFPPGN